MLFIPRVVLGNVIKDIDIEVYIDKDGNARISEVWDVNTNENTEFYKAYYNLGSSEISNFMVNMNGVMFKNIPWDTDRSFTDKKYKSGYYYTNDGVELCFGISQYGDNTYELSYEISNFIVNTSDNYQMLYWTLVMPSSDKIENVYIRVYSDFEFDENLFVKGYGKEGMKISTYDRDIVIDSLGSMGSDEYVTLLVKFNNGTFNTSVTLDKTFDEYLDMASSGSTSYNEEVPVFAIVISIIFLVLFSGLIIWIAINSVRYGTYKLDFGETKNKVKNKGYFRDLPYKKEELSRVYWIACQYNLIRNQTDFLGAILLKWLKLGNISMENDSKNKSIVIFNNSSGLDEEEVKLYNMMYEASKDGVLEKREFEKWCTSNYSKMLKWFNNVIDKETEKLISEGMLVKTNKKKKCTVNPSMMEEAKKLKGLRNFLNDFSKIEDRDANMVHIWDEYLMYAMIFGIAKKVMKEFKDLYPEVITEEVYNNINYIYFVSHTSVSNASVSYSSGGGGAGSFGGGGSMGSR